MVLLIIYGFISILFSFICSILEAVLLSVTPTFIRSKKNEGKAFAKDLEIFKKDIDKPLIAILTLNTIAHTVGAILVGVQAKIAYTEAFGSLKQQFLGISMTEDLMVGVVSTIMTILILVASEIIPKTIGATYWKKLAGFSVKTLKILIFILKWTGLLWILQLATKMVGGGNHHGSVLSRHDFAAMTDEVSESGAIQKEDYELIKNVLRYDSLTAKDVMTPKTVMQMAQEDQSLEIFYQESQPFSFSRIPLYKSNRDEISGILLKNDLLVQLVEGNKDVLLKNIKRPAIIVKYNTVLRSVFEQLKEERSHMAVVVGEYGNVIGLLTLEDIFETLFGLEILDETDSISDLQEYARKLWEEKAKKLGLNPNNTLPK